MSVFKDVLLNDVPFDRVALTNLPESVNLGKLRSSIDSARNQFGRHIEAFIREIIDVLHPDRGEVYRSNQARLVMAMYHQRKVPETENDHMLLAKITKFMEALLSWMKERVPIPSTA